MSQPRVLPIALPLLLCLCVLLGGCASPAPRSGSSSRPEGGADDPGYVRVIRPDADTVELQIALGEFRPAKGPGPSIWLVGASHIGESNYFARLQAHLEAQELVLFEGVGASSGSHRFDPAAGTSVPHALATSLGLVFQLAAIDYDRPGFRNSDLSLAQIRQLLLQDATGPGADTGSQAGREFEQLLEVMDGSSLLGMLVHGGLKLIGTSPRLREITKILLIETLGQFDGDLARIKGIPPALQRLLVVIIQERNKVVVRDLQAELRAKRPATSIAVFYGAGHMADLEQRLRAELGYRPKARRWLTAVSVNTRRAGLSEAGLEALRDLVHWQMEVLRP